VRVLVVGGAGYVGSPLVYRLWQDGHDVTVLDVLLFGGESLIPLQNRERFRLVAGDLRNETLASRIMPDQDAVVLLGAIVGEPACNRDPNEALSTNLHGSRKILKAAVGAGVPKFLFVSTCSNYGISDSESPVTETAPLKPISTYSESKVQAEQDVIAAAQQNFHPTVLRLSTAFGISPRMRFDLLISDFTSAAVRKRKIVIYGEQFWRPYVHVADIADAIVKVLEADDKVVSGEVFNIGSNSNNMKKLDLGRAVQELVPGTELEFVERNDDPRSYRVDFAKFRETLSFETTWSIRDGIQEIAEALQSGLFRDPTADRYRN
jgi:nucleoside-diphosphate-sugar epimerase